MQALASSAGGVGLVVLDVGFVALLQVNVHPIARQSQCGLSGDLVSRLGPLGPARREGLPYLGPLPIAIRKGCLVKDIFVPKQNTVLISLTGVCSSA